MKRLQFLFLFIGFAFLLLAQDKKGKVLVEYINSVSLQNSGGENPVRRVTVYLPPGYDATTNRYPVIYYLHGFSWSDSLLIASDHLDRILDKAISQGKIRPVIVVMPNEYTLFRGSFYTNSSLTGNWADFTAKDVVKYIDGHFRTIQVKDSRGISGHSMGGHGALKMGMLFPEVFSSVYALSPGLLDIVDDVGQGSLAYKRAGQIKSTSELVKGWKEVQACLVIALGRTYSPNQNLPPFFADLPFTYNQDSLVINSKILNLWKKNSPINMIDEYAGNLRKLKALKLDWGRNDEFTHIPITCKAFSKKLETLQINHYAEEYIGTHGSKICSDDGRILNEMLPFFDTYLSFETLKFSTPLK